MYENHTQIVLILLNSSIPLNNLLQLMQRILNFVLVFFRLGRGFICRKEWFCLCKLVLDSFNSIINVDQVFCSSKLLNVPAMSPENIPYLMVSA